ncbi:homocysteine methyltransferase [Zopfochytrium polystomum]|nr:homocysteine methyltransferase [Zopfochytrium polystomum]
MCPSPSSSHVEAAAAAATTRNVVAVEAAAASAALLSSSSSSPAVAALDHHHHHNNHNHNHNRKAAAAAAITTPSPPQPPQQQAVASSVLASFPGACVIDGGLATELEADGIDLSGNLWSARLLIEDPAAIKAVHKRYLAAGADVITTATYQASPHALLSLTPPVDPRRIFSLAVELARDAIREHLAEHPGSRGGNAAAGSHRPRPPHLVAASMGSYGATLADGSEYTGDFRGMTRESLAKFHRDRVEIALAGNPDILAFETVPSLLEVLAISDALESLATPTRPALPPSWISLSCRADGGHTNAGEDIGAVAGALAHMPGLAAIGINCTAPAGVEEGVRRIRRALEEAGRGRGEVGIVVYPNSGEEWDGAAKVWRGEGLVAGTVGGYAELARRWVEAGATGVGGCCRTTPRHVGELRKVLVVAASSSSSSS